MFSFGGGSQARSGYAIPASDRMFRVTQRDDLPHVIQVEQEAYRNLIKNTATNMLSNFALLKSSLELAVTAYLKEIENKWFRDDGRKRAQALRTKITNAKTTAQLIPALKEVINAGNEDKDSLKTFIFNSINLNFSDNKLSNWNYAHRLKEIITEITKMQSAKSLPSGAGLYKVAHDADDHSQELMEVTPSNTL